MKVKSSPFRPAPSAWCALVAAFAALTALRGPRRGPLLVTHPWGDAEDHAVALAEVDIAGDRRTAWTVGTPGRVAWKASIPEDARLLLAFDVDPPNAPVRLRLVVDGSRVLHDEWWEPGPRGWRDRAIDLGGLAGRETGLELRAEGAAATIHVAQPSLVGRGAGPDRPNVLVYLVDCLRADHVGAYGYGRPTTPEIDRLAADGVLFERVQACASWTKPAVGCLFTGLYPSAHGARTLDDSLDPDVPTLAQVFRAHGYATAAWVANPFVAARAYGLSRGFERVVQTIAQPPGVNINDLPADAADITRPVEDWLGANRGRRFFLYLHSLDLHEDYRRRPPFAATFLDPDRQGVERRLDLYDNELAYNDREIGRVLQVLLREGLYDRTIVVITADHGEEFGEHGVPNHGHSLFQGVVHVPLVLKLPGSAHRGARVPALASGLDLAPTLLELAGLPPLAVSHGRSLVPLIEGRAKAVRNATLAEQISSKEVLYGGRSGSYTYIRQLVPQAGELLFDVAEDPGETRNLAPEIPPGARGLVREVLRFMQVGQTGYHLAVGVGAGARARLELTTEATFAEVHHVPIVIGDTLEVSADRRHLSYAFQGGARHLMLGTQPRGADLRLKATVDGRPVAPSAVAVGAEGRSPGGVPFLLRAAEAASTPAGVDAILARTDAPLRVWYVAGPERANKATVDPELEQNLRALGYLE